MTKLTTALQTVKNVRSNRAYNKMIKESQAKLAQTTPVSYSRIYA